MRAPGGRERPRNKEEIETNSTVQAKAGGEAASKKSNPPACKKRRLPTSTKVIGLGPELSLR